MAHQRADLHRWARPLYRPSGPFKDTPEPAAGERKDPRGALLFAIQQRRVHFDFRLELDDVLKSWAIPKGLAIARGDKRRGS